MNMKKNSAQPTNKNHVGPYSKPKRPLSAYNLFYRFKRQKILEAVALCGAAQDKESIRRLVAAPLGLEDRPQYAPAVVSSSVLDAFRRENIRTALERNTEARDTRKRLHRKSSQGAWNGSMNFVELRKLMNASWRDCDAFAKSVLQELADEGRVRYRRRIEEYGHQCRRAKAQGQNENVGKATPTSANEKHDFAKKKMPVGTLIAQEAPPLPPSKIDAPREDCAMNKTAKAMVQLATSAPSKNVSKMCGSFGKEKNHTVGPSNLPDNLFKNDNPNESNSTRKESVGPMQNTLVPLAAPSSSEHMSPVAFPHAIDERLALRVREKLTLRVREKLTRRVRELERQLEGERAVRARVRASEGEIMSQQWNTRDDCRGRMAVLDNAIPCVGAAYMAPPTPPGPMFPHDGQPWGLFPAGTVHPSARMMMPSGQPSFTASQMKLPEGFDGSPFKKQRIG